MQRLFFLAFLFFSFFTNHFVYANANSSFGYEQCNWLVKYRNQTYDLTPLTRTGLSRPIESDLKPVLERVPEAAEKLRKVSDHAKDAKAHSMIGSVAISIFIASRIAKANTRDPNDDTRLQLDLASLIGGVFFLTATYESWKATKASEETLVQAIDLFNEKSPYKILPAENDGVK